MTPEERAAAIMADYNQSTALEDLQEDIVHQIQSAIQSERERIFIELKTQQPLDAKSKSYAYVEGYVDAMNKVSKAIKGDSDAE